MEISSPSPSVLSQFFSNFWQILIEVAKSIDREEIREKISGAYTYLLGFITYQFLSRRNASVPRISPLTSTLNRKLIQFGEKYQWNLTIQDKSPLASQHVITPPILDMVLQEYINFTQEKLPNDLDQVKELPQQTRSRKARGKKFAGSFFTPENLTRFLVKKVISNFLTENSKQPIDRIVVLDPSMGSGIFLVESARMLLQQFTCVFPQKKTRDLIIEILNNHLFGIDILSEAVQTAKVRLTLWAAAEILPADLPTFLREINFKQHLLCNDALTISAENLFRIFGCNAFSVLIGNPPYLHTRTGLINEDARARLKSVFSDVAKGQWDLCTLFIRRVGEFITPNGHWGFVLPTRLLSNEHYELIRHWLIENFHIRSLVDVGIAFPDAGVEVFLLIAGPRAIESASISFEKFDGSGTKNVGEMPIAELTRFPFSAIPWLPQAGVRNLVVKISDQPRCLGDIVSITRGFECGFNDTSIGTTDQLVQRGHSRVNLQPIIKGSNIHRFSIVPDTPPRFCIPDWEHPAKFKTHDLFANVPKIVIRFVANDVVAAIDEIGYMNTNGVYNLHPRPPLQTADLWWVLALLNSAPVSFWFKFVFSNHDKLYPHIQKNQLEAIPIPLLSRREQGILVQISKAQYASAQDLNVTLIQNQLLNPLCVAQYLKDKTLDALLDALETVFVQPPALRGSISSRKPIPLVNELKKRYALIFKLI